MIRLFLSHAHRDWSRLKPLVDELERAGIEVWHSERDIPYGAGFQNKIIEGLERCDWILVAASGAAIESEWVKSEVQIAFSLKPDRVLVLVLERVATYQIHLHLPRLNEIPGATDVNEVAAGVRRRVSVVPEPTTTREHWETQLLTWGAAPEQIREITELCRASKDLEGFAARKVVPENSTLQQFAFAFFINLPPHKRVHETDFVLLPPGTVEHAGRSLTLKRHVWISRECSVPLLESSDDGDDGESPTCYRAVDAQRMAEAFHEQGNSSARIPPCEHLLFGLATRLIQPSSLGLEYCRDYEVGEGWKFRRCRRDVLTGSNWEVDDVPNPLSGSLETHFRLELHDE